MKILHKMLLILLALSLFGMATTLIIRSQEALEEGSRTIAQADEFLRRWERP